MSGRYEKRRLSSDEIAEILKKALCNAPDEDDKTIKAENKGMSERTRELVMMVKDIVHDVSCSNEAAEIKYCKHTKDDGGGLLVQYDGDFSLIMYGIMSILHTVLKNYSNEDADTLLKVLFTGVILMRRFEKDSK